MYRTNHIFTLFRLVRWRAYTRSLVLQCVLRLHVWLLASYVTFKSLQVSLAGLCSNSYWQDAAEHFLPLHVKPAPCEASGITIASEAATTAITSPAAAMRPRTRALPAGGVVRLFGSVVAEIVSRSFMILSVRESDAGLRAPHHYVIPPCGILYRPAIRRQATPSPPSAQRGRTRPAAFVPRSLDPLQAPLSRHPHVAASASPTSRLQA